MKLRCRLSVPNDGVRNQIMQARYGYGLLSTIGVRVRVALKNLVRVRVRVRVDLKHLVQVRVRVRGD